MRISVFQCDNCYYIPGSMQILDACFHSVAMNGWRTFYKATPEAELLKQNPGAKRMTFDDATAQIEAASKQHYIKSPVVINEDRWYERLEVLPPVNWREHSGGETFRISEAMSGDIRSVFCRIGSIYLEMNESDSTSHVEIVQKCQSFIRETGSEGISQMFQSFDENWKKEEAEYNAKYATA